MGFCTERSGARVPEIDAAHQCEAMIGSGIILIKYWLEVSEEEQTRRLEARITDERKTWKLTAWICKSYSRWYDYSRARDEMFAATDTELAHGSSHAPTTKGERLKHHQSLLSRIPYAEVDPRAKSVIVARSGEKAHGNYRDPNYPISSTR